MQEIFSFKFEIFLSFCLPGLRKKFSSKRREAGTTFFFEKIAHDFWGHAPVKGEG
jgi:hypothetical protein